MIKVRVASIDLETLSTAPETAPISQIGLVIKELTLVESASTGKYLLDNSNPEPDRVMQIYVDVASYDSFNEDNTLTTFEPSFDTLAWIASTPTQQIPADSEIYSIQDALAMVMNVLESEDEPIDYLIAKSGQSFDFIILRQHLVAAELNVEAFDDLHKFDINILYRAGLSSYVDKKSHLAYEDALDNLNVLMNSYAPA